MPIYSDLQLYLRNQHFFRVQVWTSVIACEEALIVLWHKWWSSERWARKPSKPERNYICQAPHFACWLVCGTYESLLAGCVIEKILLKYKQKQLMELLSFYGAWLLPAIFPELKCLTICPKIVICEHGNGIITLPSTYRENNNYWIIFHWWIPNSIDIRLVCLKRVHCMTSPDIPYKGCFITSLTR